MAPSEEERNRRHGRFLALVLRHDPGSIGLALDRQGWVLVSELLRACTERGHALNAETLEEVVRGDAKQRFSFDANHTRIRANQGHSIPVDLGLCARVPPRVLYHGTPAKSVFSIEQNGIEKGARQYVHLSADIATASQVGKRRGTSIVLAVEAARMHRDAHEFFLSENGVWLCDYVPSEYLASRCEWSENPLARTVLLRPWKHVSSLEASESLARELARECGDGHVLFDQDVLAVARRTSSDDVMFVTKEPHPRWALVHLTFGPHPDPNRQYPSTQWLSGMEVFVDEIMLPDHEAE